MAVITIGVALVLWGGLIYLFSDHEKRYFWLLFPGLPLSAIANLIVKRQAIVLVGQAAHVPPHLGLASPIWFLAFMVLITPVVEESIKVIPLLLRAARRMVTSRASAVWVGFGLGVSFGVGEAAFVAYAVAQIQDYGTLPWYAFTGYLSERLFTCFAHGVMTSVLVAGMQRGGRMILYGFLASVGLHLLLNTPAVMYQFKWISTEVYNFSLLIPLLILSVIFERLRQAARGPKEDQSAHEVVYWRRHVSGER
jgi:uncharacterized membrane protein YhfC